MAYQYEAFMKDPQDFKTTCLEVLVYIRDLCVEENLAVNVNNIVDHLSSVAYKDDTHRINDASQRLRKLERSGYLSKLTAETLPGYKVALSPYEATKEKKSKAGRPPSYFVLSEKGVRYCRTLADLYLDAKGNPQEREAIHPFIKEEQSLILFTSEGKRIIVLANDQNIALAAVEIWMKTTKKTVQIMKIESVVLPKEA